MNMQMRREAVDALATFMHRTKETEQLDLNRKYSAIHNAPTAALWANLPDHARLPDSAIRPIRAPQQPQPRIPDQGFRGTGGGGWCSPQRSTACGRGRGRGTFQGLYNRQAQP